MPGAADSAKLVRIGFLGLSVDVAVALVLLLFMPLGTAPTIVLAAAILLSGVSMLWVFSIHLPRKYAEMRSPGTKQDR